MADLGEPVGHEQAKRRPVVIVSANPWLESNPPVVVAVPVTRTYRQRSTHVELEPGTSGLRAVSYAKCEDVRAISPARLERRLGEADSVVMAHIDLILRRLLAL